jgi:hypothetical protein
VIETRIFDHTAIIALFRGDDNAFGSGEPPTVTD